MNIISKLIIVTSIYSNSQSAQGVDLVSSETIATQKKLTEVHKLSNGIPVVIRKENSSKIVQVLVNFQGGRSHARKGEQILGRWMYPVMAKAAKGYPREAVFALKEKFSLSLGCGEGLDAAQCALSTINDYWSEGLGLLAASIKNPLFTATDVNLTRQRLQARLKNTPRNPDIMANEVVNKVFYPRDNPYFLPHKEGLKQLEKLKTTDLKKLHNEILNASRMHIVVVSSLPKAKILSDLENAFGKISKKPFKQKIIADPEFSKDKTFLFQERDVETAYIIAKVNTSNFNDKSAPASKLMFDILSDKMALEIRTKRSLSYAANAYTIQFNIGLGRLYISTPKPQEAIDVLANVIKDLKNNPLTTENLEEYKRKKATHYYLTQESHSSMAGAISEWFWRTGSADGLYEFPTKLATVTPKDIQQQAKDQLKNFRVGILARKGEFQQSWLKPLGI